MASTIPPSNEVYTFSRFLKFLEIGLVEDHLALRYAVGPVWGRGKDRLREMRDIYIAFDEQAFAEAQKVMDQADALEEEFVKGNIGPWQDWWYRDYKYQLRKKGCRMEEALWMKYRAYKPTNT